MQNSDYLNLNSNRRSTQYDIDFNLGGSKILVSPYCNELGDTHNKKANIPFWISSQ